MNGNNLKIAMEYGNVCMMNGNGKLKRWILNEKKFYIYFLGLKIEEFLKNVIVKKYSMKD